MEPERKIIQIDDTSPKISKEKRRQRLLVLLFILVLTAGLFALLWSRSRQETVTVKEYTTAEVRLGEFVSATEASGTVILPAQVEILSPQEGYADSLFVTEGDTITETDVLAALDVPDLDDQKNSLTVELEQAQIELENLQSGYYFQIRQLERDLTRLDKDIAEAEEDVLSMKELAQLKSSRQTDYEDALDVLEDLQEQKEDKTAALAETAAAEDIALRKQQAAISRLEVDLDIVLDDIEETQIKSPITGEVLEINESLSIPGSTILETDTLFVVADRSQVYIDFDVYEQYAGLLEIGGRMTVTVGTTTMEAEIIRIGKIATLDTDGLSAMISVRARPLTEQTLTPGASAVATITLSVEEDVLLLPRGAWLTTGGQKYVYLAEDGRAVKTAVTLGEIQGTDVEILTGLAAGDRVITSGYQNFIDQDVIELK